MLRRHVLTSLIALALAGGSARADIPRKINFQGRLADAAGTPKTGVFAMTFAENEAAHDENHETSETPNA